MYRDNHVFAPQSWGNLCVNDHTFPTNFENFRSKSNIPSLFMYYMTNGK